MAETAVAPPAPAEVQPDANSEPVSVETADGRIFSGVGVTEEALQKTIDARAAEPKPQKGPKRFNKLTVERDEAVTEAQRIATERDAIKAELEALKATPAPTPVSSSPAPTPVQPPSAPAQVVQQPVQAQITAQPIQQGPPKLKAFTDQIGTKFETWEDAQDAYHEARDAYSTAKLRSELTTQQAIRSDTDAYQQMRQRGSSKYPDFAQRIDSTPPVFPLELQRQLIRRPDADDVFYRLATDPGFAMTTLGLWQANPETFASSFQFAPPTGGPVPAASGQPVIINLPPPPMQPVGGGSPTTTRSSADLAAQGTDDYDRSGYREQRRREREGFRRR